MADLIDRQTAIDAVNKLVEWYKEKWHESRPTSESVIDVLNDLPSAQSQWIPCSERLPDEDSDILVTYAEKDEKRIVPVNYGRGTWFDCVFNMALNPVGVLAWMPLPKQYGGDSE